MRSVVGSDWRKGGSAGELAAALPDSIDALRAAGEYERAVTLAEQLLALRQDAPEATSYEIADAERLVETLRHVVELPEASRRELARADDMKRLLMEHDVAGEYREGAAVAESQLEIMSRILGEEHPEVTESHRAVAFFLGYLGEHARVESHLRRALEVRRRILGEDHPGVLILLGELAIALEDQGNYAEAERLQRAVLAKRRELLGKGHLAVATSLNNLAYVVETQGRLAEAERLYREALAVRRRHGCSPIFSDRPASGR